MSFGFYKEEHGSCVHIVLFSVYNSYWLLWTSCMQHWDISCLPRVLPVNIWHVSALGWDNRIPCCIYSCTHIGTRMHKHTLMEASLSVCHMGYTSVCSHTCCCRACNKETQIIWTAVIKTHKQPDGIWGVAVCSIFTSSLFMKMSRCTGIFAHILWAQRHAATV